MDHAVIQYLPVMRQKKNVYTTEPQPQHRDIIRNQTRTRKPHRPFTDELEDLPTENKMAMSIDHERDSRG